MRDWPVARMVGALTLALSFAACEGQIGGGSTADVQRELLAPPRANFERLADAMQPHCGTLDCHGQAGRNLRLFGGRGLRLLPGANRLAGAISEAPCQTAAMYDEPGRAP